MVDHDHQRIMPIRWGKVRDEIYRELLEGQGGRGWDRSERGASGMMVDFVLLTYGTSVYEGIDERGQSRPPEVSLKEGFGAKSSGMSRGRGVVYGANNGLSFMWGDVHVALEV